jgi:NADP-dependent 3-hydroxy acid dehydrogenase YdfG
VLGNKTCFYPLSLPKVNKNMPNAIVTGATEGIGRAIAEIFLSNGYGVAVCGRTYAKMQRLKSEWEHLFPGATVVYKNVDLSIKEDAIAFAKAMVQELRSVDILVNNAGTFVPGDIGEEEDGVLEHLMGTNLYSAYHVTRAVMPVMKAAGAGHIFNISSVAGLKAYRHGGSYSISKYALTGFSDNLREELKAHNIKVTAIFPGAVYTQSWSGSGVLPERIMEAEDIAKMVWSSSHLSPQANVESIVIRPIKGDL